MPITAFLFLQAVGLKGENPVLTTKIASLLSKAGNGLNMTLKVIFTYIQTTVGN